MRQLAATGWMHNRVRMIVACFLVKDLLLDWRVGERHFFDHLVDGDPANNNGGWQWAASTGTDPQPWFRIFNPVAQGEKFDPDGGYVRRWVPELAGCRPLVHVPWTPRRARRAATRPRSSTTTRSARSRSPATRRSVPLTHSPHSRFRRLLPSERRRPAGQETACRCSS